MDVNAELSSDYLKWMKFLTFFSQLFPNTMTLCLVIRSPCNHIMLWVEGPSFEVETFSYSDKLPCFIQSFSRLSTSSGSWSQHPVAHRQGAKYCSSLFAGIEEVTVFLSLCTIEKNMVMYPNITVFPNTLWTAPQRRLDCSKPEIGRNVFCSKQQVQINDNRGIDIQLIN